MNKKFQTLLSHIWKLISFLTVLIVCRKYRNTVHVVKQFCNSNWMQTQTIVCFIWQYRSSYGWRPVPAVQSTKANNRIESESLAVKGKNCWALLNRDTWEVGGVIISGCVHVESASNMISRIMYDPQRVHHIVQVKKWSLIAELRLESENDKHMVRPRFRKCLFWKHVKLLDLEMLKKVQRQVSKGEIQSY